MTQCHQYVVSGLPVHAASALRRIRWTRAERSRAISSLYCTDEELEEAEADFFNFAGA